MRVLMLLGIGLIFLACVEEQEEESQPIAAQESDASPTPQPSAGAPLTDPTPVPTCNLYADSFAVTPPVTAHIVAGEILTSTLGEPDFPLSTTTIHDVRLTTAYRGPLQANDVIKVRELGGYINGSPCVYPETVLMADGENYLLFLEENNEGDGVYGPYFARFLIDECNALRSNSLVPLDMLQALPGRPLNTVRKEVRELYESWGAAGGR